MRGGSGSEVAREVGTRRRSAKRRVMYNVGIISLTHFNSKGGYTAKYLDKVLTGVRLSKFWAGALRRRGVDPGWLGLRLLAIFECDGRTETCDLLMWKHTQRLAVLRQTLMMFGLVW
jgi:hypothetical protein